MAPREVVLVLMLQMHSRGFVPGWDGFVDTLYTNDKDIDLIHTHTKCDVLR